MQPAVDLVTVTSLDDARARRESSDMLRYLDVDGRLLPGREAPLPDTETVRLYEAMLRIRTVDARMVILQRQGRIGFYIGGTGEEATIIGTVGALRGGDWLFPCYRENGGYLLRGMPFQRFVDNLFGNANDPVHGRQMPNHISWREANVTSVSSPIGTQIVQATGAAFAAKLLGRDDAMMAFFGDGATSSYDFHTGLNFAGVWKAPVVFVCRDNEWAISLPRSKQCAAEYLVDKAPGYGVKGVIVDGNDLFACFAAARDALAVARRGEGATLLECMTYRVQGHSTSDDPRVYRPDAEVEPWRGRDPLVRVKKYLVARGLWSEARDEQTRRDVEAACSKAAETAEHTSPPALETVFTDVFSTMPWHLREQFAEARAASTLDGAGAAGAFPP